MIQAKNNKIFYQIKLKQKQNKKKLNGVTFMQTWWLEHMESELFSPVAQTTLRMLCGLNATTHKTLSLG